METRITGSRRIIFFTSTLLLCFGTLCAHKHTLHKFEKARQLALAKAAQEAEDPEAGANRKICQLTIDLIDAPTQESLPGLVRVVNVSTGKAIKLGELIARERNWYAMPRRATVRVPQTRLKIEAFQGLETERHEHVVNLRGVEATRVQLPLKRFYQASANGLQSGNPHLHLRRLTRAEAERYLRLVPQADGLDLLYVSYLERSKDDETYISNVFTKGDLTGLSGHGALLENGQEHRHNFEAYGEGYGHVMFLDIRRLVQPVSIGPGIMNSGTDGIPLRRGIKTMRGDGATVIWCHNEFGLEDIPNWLEGLLDAQNIFDGGNHGSYKDTFYRYLNLGMKVPFSTGTDWFIYDFSRVYVPVSNRLTSRNWRDQLASGKSFITNGTFLAFEAEGHQPGDTIALSRPGSLQISGSATGRNDFQAIEVLYNGRVVHSSSSQSVQGHYRAKINHALQVREPGWVALRIPLEAGKNEFGKNLFAHTSPVYVEVAGKRVFRTHIAETLISEMQQSIGTINAKGTFTNDRERQSILAIYRKGIADLKRRLGAHSSGR